MIDRQQFAQQALFGGVPIGLTKWLAGRQRPLRVQALAFSVGERAAKVDLHGADLRPRPGFDFDEQGVSAGLQVEPRRKIAFGGQELTALLAQPALKR